MNKSIRATLEKGFQSDAAKTAQSKCCAYAIGANSELAVSVDETAIVRWIFEYCPSGDSLDKFVAQKPKVIDLNNYAQALFKFDSGFLSALATTLVWTALIGTLCSITWAS